uniref:Argonaute-2 n=1 Tax=Hemiscolopendra marginata TaxID=943146 RepID=A0A646QFB5_9MYRI
MGKKKKGKGGKQPQEKTEVPADIPSAEAVSVLQHEPKEQEPAAAPLQPKPKMHSGSGDSPFEEPIKKFEEAVELPSAVASDISKSKRTKEKSPKLLEARETSSEKQLQQPGRQEQFPASVTGARPKSVEHTRGRGRGQERPIAPVISPQSPTEELAPRGKGRGKGKGRGRGQEIEKTFIPGEVREMSIGDTLKKEIKKEELPPRENIPMKEKEVKKGPIETIGQIAKTLPDTGLLPPRRKDFGTLGRPISLRANHFQVTFDPKRIIHHYDIDIKPQITAMKSLKRKIILKMTELFPRIFGQVKCVFDGEKNMYANLDLRLDRNGMSFDVKWIEPDQKREKSFQVDVKKVAEVKLFDLQQFLEGKNRNCSQTSIQALDIVMRHLSSVRYLTIGRSVFPDVRNVQDLGGGAEMWRGFYQSLRPGQWKTLQLNLDVSNRSFYKEQSMLEFICELFRLRGEDDLRGWVMKPYEREILLKEVKGLKIEVIHTPMKRSYKIVGLSAKSAELQIFPLITEAGTTQSVSVAKYFLDQYKKSLRFPKLPCLQAQPLDKHRYLPIEVCRIPRGQQHKKLSDIQTAEMIKAAATPAFIRERNIQDMVRGINFKNDDYVRDFGLSFNDSLMKVEGRVLPAPEIQMKNSFKVQPRIGVWDMRSKEFFEPVEIRSWGMLIFVQKDRFRNQDVDNFTREFVKIGRSVGSRVEQAKFIEYCIRINDVRPIFDQIQQKYKDLQLLLVILPGKTPIYAEVKRCGDNIAGISTQCIQSKNAQKANPATLTNIFMKINAKLGGTNSVVQSRPISSKIFQTPVIILGADVTHPPAGDKSKPSIAAIIGSLDRYAVKYKAKICVQKHRVETITTLKDKVRELLMAFYKNTKFKPNRIIFYRDGVGEGQFYEILRIELLAIRAACQSLEQTYNPQITFLVVQKRHHTRLFCDDKEAIGKSKNVPPGTTVDRAIVHPIENDFYLCSHQGIQGTSRPTHYHVLWDDSDFSADELQQLTYELCHTYVRCTRSVSIPSPAYYAHLAAFRARHHLENIQRECDNAGGDPNDWLEKMQKAVETHEKLGNMYFA